MRVPKPGFVYVLFNPAFPDLVKIGRTCAPVEKRAHRLSKATGVPQSFIVVHEELVGDCAEVERLLHRKFARRRVSRRREFFRVALKEAVRALLAVAGRHRVKRARGFSSAGLRPAAAPSSR